MLNYRCILILNYLLLAEEPVGITRLAEHFAVSKRAMQYDLQKIDDWLKYNNLPLLKRKRGIGVEIVNDKAIRGKIKELYKKLGVIDYIYSPQERCYIVLEMLFNSEGTITLQEIADKLYVSKATAFNDVTEVKKYLLQYEIILLSKPDKGFYLKGNEKKIRQAYFDLLWKIYYHYGTFNSKDLNSPLIINIIRKWEKEKFPINILSNIDINYIIDCLLSYQKDWNVSFTDKSFASLCIKIAVKIARLKKGFSIKLSEEEFSFLRNQYEHTTVKDIVGKLEEKFNIKFSIDEVAQITLDILGAKIQEFNIQKDLDTFLKKGVITEEALIIADRIVNEVENSIGINIKQDENLILDLALHITSLLYRLKFNLMEEKNPILEDFKMNYPDIFEISREVVTKILFEFVDKPVAEDEIGFIAMHLGAALYRVVQTEKQNKQIKVVVVCGTGLGTAKLLASQLKNEFDNIEIIAIVPYYNIKDKLCKYSPDYIISTVPLDDLDIDYILINPLLSNDDILKLRQFLKVKSDNLSYPTMLKAIVKEVSKIVKLDDIQKIQIEINVLKQLLQKDSENKPKGIKLPRLTNLLKKEAIILQRKVSNWKEAIRLAGKPLIDLGYISESYVKAAIENKERLGGHIAIGNGVALPHASPKEGVNRVCFSLLTLSKPVNFGNPQNDPIDVVIMMATTNSWIHIEALSDLVTLLKNEDAMTRIRSTKNKSEVLNILEDIKS